ncbi:MAG: MBOAT family protein [Bacteroidales bacterium]|nr:MBOAT family protein [Bacteroidales bacterium]
MADWKFVSLLAASGFVNFYLAKLIAKKEEGKIRKFIFYSGIVFNIAILFYFKYFNFFVQSFVTLLNYSGVNINFTPFHILLPLGISFFTFQMIGYLIDVNNEEIKPTNDLLSFFTYLAYFPKILSGPIERVQRFLPQIQKKREFDYDIAVDGLRQILWGLFKKMIIADRLTPIVNNIFNNYQTLNGSTLLLGAIFYIISLYADFSGYSDMACGVSKLFNIRITNNFAFPFFSTNISDFWKKWHISLTSWLMDYVFTPLSFILRGYKKIGLAISILITFLIVGLWHGANLTFIVFGFLHGLYFVPIIIKGSMNKNKFIAAGKLIPSASESLGVLGLFLLVSITSIFGRSENIGQALGYLSEIVSPSLFTVPTLTNMQNVLTTMIFIGICILIEWGGREQDHAIAIIGIKWKRTLRSVFYFAIVLAIFWFGGNEQQFIYFQF